MFPGRRRAPSKQEKRVDEKVPSRVGWAEMARWASIPKTRLKTSDLPVPMPPPTFAICTPPTIAPNSRAGNDGNSLSAGRQRPVRRLSRVLSSRCLHRHLMSAPPKAATSQLWISASKPLWFLLQEKVSVWGDEHMGTKGVWELQGKYLAWCEV